VLSGAVWWEAWIHIQCWICRRSATSMKVLSQQDIFSSMNYSTGSMPPNICAGCSQVS